LGSTRVLVNRSGAVQNSYTYDAYGNILAKTGTAANPFDYAGEFTDSESGLIYLRARYYDPTTAQFINRDPIGNSPLQNRNPYSYASANPNNRVDPSGLWDVFGFGGAGVGAPGPVSGSVEGLSVVGYSGGQGFYVGGIAAVGAQVGGAQNYVAIYTGTETTYHPFTGQVQSNSISIQEGSFGIEVPGIAGFGAGVGAYETSDESGVFIFGSGGLLGEHGAIGFGFSVPSSPSQWTYPPNTGRCLQSPSPRPF